MTTKGKAPSSLSRWIVVCVKCDKVLSKEGTLKEAFHQAFRHTKHANDDVLLVDTEAKAGKVDITTRGGMTFHRRVRGEPAGGSVVAEILAPKSYVAKPYAVVCERCQAMVGEAGDQEEAFVIARRHQEHPDREVFVIYRLADEGDRHVVTRSGLLVSVRQDGEPEGGRWQGLLEAGMGVAAAGGSR